LDRSDQRRLWCW